MWVGVLGGGGGGALCHGRCMTWLVSVPGLVSAARVLQRAQRCASLVPRPGTDPGHGPHQQTRAQSYHSNLAAAAGAGEL